MSQIWRKKNNSFDDFPLFTPYFPPFSLLLFKILEGYIWPLKYRGRGVSNPPEYASVWNSTRIKYRTGPDPQTVAESRIRIHSPPPAIAGSETRGGQTVASTPFLNSRIYLKKKEIKEGKERKKDRKKERGR